MPALPDAPYPILPDEAGRLKALQRLQILDTLPERLFDDIVLLASEICGTPIGLISFIDSDRQWFKARVGLAATETPRSMAFCAHAIAEPDRVMTIGDAMHDARFADNPLVLGDPSIRFYAGAPIVAASGDALGTVCVIDTVPRALSATQEAALMALARQTAALLEARHSELQKEAESVELARKINEALSGDDASHAGFRQRQRLAAVGQLTGGIAHDFNNLLQTITGSLQLIERKAEDAARVRRWAAGALTAATHGARLTSQLLSFSRDHLPDATPIAVAKLVGDMGELLAGALGPQIQLHFQLTGAKALTLGDATQLEAAVLNMAINARDAMHGVGSIGISTQVERVEGDATLVDGAYLVLRVIDTGPGMPPEVMQRAFEPFYTTKSADRGTGLGLAQVLGYATRAGGTARIESRPGEGTTIGLWLRIVEADHATQPGIAVKAAAPGKTTQANVMLVDDNLAMREVLAELLSEQGYRVVGVANGPAALLHATQFELPDIVLIDCALSGMNGAALADQMRAIDTTLPMIFLTGYADVSEVLPALSTSAVVLKKPVLLDEITARIEQMLGARKTRAQDAGSHR